MPETSAFDDLMGVVDYSMFIFTARRGDKRGGRFLVRLSDKNRTYGFAQDAERLAVHFVPADADELAELFGGRTGDEVDKFARGGWDKGPHGLPIVRHCENWFARPVLNRERTLFDFHRARRIEPGHEA